MCPPSDVAISAIVMMLRNSLQWFISMRLALLWILAQAISTMCLLLTRRGGVVSVVVDHHLCVVIGESLSECQDSAEGRCGIRVYVVSRILKPIPDTNWVQSNAMQIKSENLLFWRIKAWITANWDQFCMLTKLESWRPSRSQVL